MDNDDNSSTGTNNNNNHGTIKKGNHEIYDDIIDDDDSLTTNNNDCITAKSYQPTLTPCLSLQPTQCTTSTNNMDSSGNRRTRPHLARLKMTNDSTSKKQKHTNSRNPFQPTTRKKNRRMTQQNISKSFFSVRK